MPFLFLVVTSGIIGRGESLLPGVDKALFYTVIAGRDLNQVNQMLEEIEGGLMQEKYAYQGALLMKKASLVKKAKEKLIFFKSGRLKLEAAIKSDGDNIEYHFLRLIFQENSPKNLNYKDDLLQDSKLLRISFKKLTPVVQQAVKDYSRRSVMLNTADF